MSVSASLLAEMHETTLLFNPNRRKKDGMELPFGGKKVLFSW